MNSYEDIQFANQMFTKIDDIRYNTISVNELKNSDNSDNLKYNHDFDIISNKASSNLDYLLYDENKGKKSKKKKSKK